MEELLCTYGGEFECGSENEIEIEKGKRRDQEILPVNFPEIKCRDALASHQQNPGDYHTKHQYDRQRGKIFLHKDAPFRIKLGRPTRL
jgi:hypothetical protein